MGLWCGTYTLLHHGLFAISYLVFEPERNKEIDEPQSKYWGSTLRRISTARYVALIHAIVSWVWSLRVLFLGWDGARDIFERSEHAAYWLPIFCYDALNDASSIHFMRHSLGYFVQELLHVLVHEPDPIFIAHHILYLSATFPVCAMSNRGWPLIAIATALAEVTNPLQLSWEMAKAFDRLELYNRLSAPFTVAFTLARGILMPIFVADQTNYIFLRGRRFSDQHTDSKVSSYLVVKWTLSLFYGGLAASILWLALLIRGFFKFRRTRKSKQQEKESLDLPHGKLQQQTNGHSYDKKKA